MSLEKIQLALPDDVFVEVIGELVAPGLAITPALLDADTFSGSWAATHIATGRTVIPGAACLSCVREATKRLLVDGVDWTRGADITADGQAQAAVAAYWNRMIYCVGDCTIPDGV